MWESRYGLPEGPSWANGAFVYLTPRHAAEIQETMLATRTLLFLQPNHILVSEEYKDLVQVVMSYRPAGPRRDSFLTPTAGEFSEPYDVP